MLFITASLENVGALPQYDNTNNHDKSKWALKQNWQHNFRHSSKHDIVKTKACLHLSTEEGICLYDDMNTIGEKKQNSHLQKYSISTK